MKDKNDVKEALEYLISECCTNSQFDYYDDIKTAIALLEELKEHIEPIVIKKETFNEFYGAVACCPRCDCMWIMYMDNDMHYCPECGTAVKWE